MGRSVKVASPIVWQSKDHLRLRKKQEFIKHLGFAQIKAILREHGLAFDESDSYDVCVQRLVTSRWIPSRDTIQSYQRMFAKPVRSLEQKMEDRIRLCKAADVGNLSCEEMKLWLKRNGGRVPDANGESDRRRMARLIRTQMRVTTPFFKSKAAPKRPKKGKSLGFIRRKPSAAAAAPGPVRAVVNVVNVGNVAKRENLSTPPRNPNRCTVRNNVCEVKEPETPIPIFNVPPTPTLTPLAQNSQNCNANSFSTPRCAKPIRNAMRSASVLQTPLLTTIHEPSQALMTPCNISSDTVQVRPRKVPDTPITPSPMLSLLAAAEGDTDTDDEEKEKDDKDADLNSNCKQQKQQQKQQKGGGFLNALIWG